MITPAERESLFRLRQPGHAYENSQDACAQRFEDEKFAIDLALREYPADDTCEMTRQELIAEVQRLKRGDFSQEEFQNLCHNFDESDECRFLDGCRDYQRKLFGNKKPEGA